jgi:hypothetical protein
MKHSIPIAPSAQITLRAHPPAPARVEIEYQSSMHRMLRAAFWVVICWSLMPWTFIVPPHYPWALAAFVAGVYLGFHHWNGRYVVRTFSGSCPRCGRPLALKPGSRINLPHTLTCFGCHHEPVLELGDIQNSLEIAHSAAVLSHRDRDCSGEWGADRAAVRPFLICRGCGARHPATLEAQRLADRENEMGRILRNLTREGGTLL